MVSESRSEIGEESQLVLSGSTRREDQLGIADGQDSADGTEIPCGKRGHVGESSDSSVGERLPVSTQLGSRPKKSIVGGY